MRDDLSHRRNTQVESKQFYDKLVSDIENTGIIYVLILIGLMRGIIKRKIENYNVERVNFKCKSTT